MSESYSFGFSEFTTWPLPFRRDLELYRKHGASVIEVCEFKLAHNDYAALDELRSYGLRPSSIQAKVHSVFVDSMAARPEDTRDRINAIKEEIALTAPHVPKNTPFIVISGIPPDGNFAMAWNCTIEALKELGECAQKHEMRIAFEPLSPANIHKDTAVWGLDQGLDLVDRVGHPAVGICVDTWNVWQTPSLSEVIAQCGSRIFVVQLSDWRTPRSTADRYSLGDGVIPLPEIMRSIRKTGFDGPWVVEILSSYHLEGSLWKSDMDELLEKNHAAFERLWSQSDPG